MDSGPGIGSECCMYIFLSCFWNVIKAGCTCKGMPASQCLYSTAYASSYISGLYGVDREFLVSL